MGARNKSQYQSSQRQSLGTARDLISKSEPLLETVMQCIDSARAQVARSRRLVAQSHEIVGRVKTNLARASRIQAGARILSKNPFIVYRPGLNLKEEPEN